MVQKMWRPVWKQSMKGWLGRTETVVCLWSAGMVTLKIRSVRDT